MRVGSVLLSSGASGGSVGLAHLARPAGMDAETITIGPLSGSEALAADTTGLLAGDLVAGLTGIRFPSVGLVEPADFRWRDRAALHAEVWEASAARPSTGLGMPFDDVARAPVGYAVFNSTDSASNCKVLVSQLDLATRSASKTRTTCTGTSAEFSNTVDLLDHLGDECDAGMTWSTAVLLSARFPFVSPSGRISPSTVPDSCTSGWDMQLLDGGIVDNSALGTTSDIFTELADIIRDHNAQAGAEPIVIPVVMFVSNEPGADVTTDTSQSRPEVLAPLAALDGAGSVQSSPSAWLTRLSTSLDDVCVNDERCDTAVASFRDRIPGSIVVVSPSTTPSITVPLGWTLSAFSRSRLRVEADQQRRCGREAEFVDHDHDFTASAKPIDRDAAPCRSSGEYARYGEFLNLFDGTARSSRRAEGSRGRRHKPRAA